MRGAQQIFGNLTGWVREAGRSWLFVVKYICIQYTRPPKNPPTLASAVPGSNMFDSFIAYIYMHILHI